MQKKDKAVVEIFLNVSICFVHVYLKILQSEMSMGSGLALKKELN